MNPAHPVRAKLLGDLPMHEFGERFADPLYQALREHGHGDLTGGGGEYDDTGRTTLWMSIDLRLVDLDEALAFTRRTLQTLGAPPGSELEYTVDGRTVTTPVADPLPA